MILEQAKVSIVQGHLLQDWLGHNLEPAAERNIAGHGPSQPSPWTSLQPDIYSMP